MNKEVFRLKAKCPANWDTLPFGDAIKDATGGKPKVKKGSYKQNGSLAVIDQGQDLIGGYIDDESLACKEKLPCILFGDHTKIFKFIDQPFALGADGVKVLVPKGEFDKRFLYHYLNTLKLPDNAGYSRHFKFLKEKAVVKPPLAEQKRIAAILDKADAIRRKRRQAIELADEFLRSVFLDMFGDPATNPKNWPKCTIRDVVAEVKYGTSKKASISVGKYPILRMNNITYEGNLDLTDLKYINFNKKEEHKYLAQKDDILFNRTNSRDLVGKTAVYDRVQSMAIAGYLIRVRTNIKSNPYYISAYLNSKHGKKTLKNMCKNIIGMANINAQELQDIEILLPPIDLQNKFAEITTKVRDKKKTLISAKKRANTLFKALCQGSFRGEI